MKNSTGFRAGGVFWWCGGPPPSNLLTSRHNPKLAEKADLSTVFISPQSKGEWNRRPWIIW